MDASEGNTPVSGAPWVAIFNPSAYWPADLQDAGGLQVPGYSSPSPLPSPLPSPSPTSPVLTPPSPAVAPTSPSPFSSPSSFPDHDYIYHQAEQHGQLVVSESWTEALKKSTSEYFTKMFFSWGIRLLWSHGSGPLGVAAIPHGEGVNEIAAEAGTTSSEAPRSTRPELVDSLAVRLQHVLNRKHALEETRRTVRTREDVSTRAEQKQFSKRRAGILAEMKKILKALEAKITEVEEMSVANGRLEARRNGRQEREDERNNDIESEAAEDNLAQDSDQSLGNTVNASGVRTGKQVRKQKKLQTTKAKEKRKPGRPTKILHGIPSADGTKRQTDRKSQRAREAI